MLPSPPGVNRLPLSAAESAVDHSRRAARVPYVEKAILAAAVILLALPPAASAEDASRAAIMMGDSRCTLVDGQIRCTLNSEPTFSSIQPAVTLEGVTITVAPFLDLSPYAEREHFTEGLAENIVIALAKLRGVQVVAAPSGSRLAGVGIDSRVTAARYVLTGSVRKSWSRTRVSAQVLDATNGRQLWADSYDIALDDFLDAHDEVTRRVVTEVEVLLVEGESARTWRKTTKNAEAYDFLLRGMQARLRFSRADLAVARRLDEEALARDPDFSMAMVELSRVHLAEAWSGWSNAPGDSYLRALHWANQAVMRAPWLGEAYSALGEVHLIYLSDHQAAIGYLRRAVELQPDSARNNMALGYALAYDGSVEEAIQFARRAVQLSPNPPSSYFASLGVAYAFAGYRDDAMKALESASSRLPDFIWPHVYLTLIEVDAGNVDKARRHAREVLRIDPRFSAAEHPAVTAIRDPDARKRVVMQLQRAGL